MKNFEKYLEDHEITKYDHLRFKDTKASFWVPEGMEKEMVEFFTNSKFFFNLYIQLIPKIDGKSLLNANIVTLSLYHENSSSKEYAEDLIILALKGKFSVNIFKKKINE